MKPTLTTLSAALAIALGGLATLTVDPPSAAAQRGPGRAALTYVTKAGASDLFEIQSGQLAAQRARRPGVREFAQMLVRDHTRTTQLVAQAARADGVVPPPPRLEARHRSMLRQLERARAGEFDRLYLNQQIPAHQEALALHRNYARAGRGNDLRRVAASAVPIIQHHLAEARQLQRRR